MPVVRSIEGKSNLSYLSTPGIESILAHARIFGWSVPDIIDTCSLVKLDDMKVIDAILQHDTELYHRANSFRLG